MDNLNNISYEDGWTNAETPVYREERLEQTQAPQPKTKAKKPLIIFAQIIICVLLVLSAFIIKLIGSDLYNNIHTWYTNELNDEIIINTDFEHYRLDKAFNAAAD